MLQGPLITAPISMQILDDLSCPLNLPGALSVKLSSTKISPFTSPHISALWHTIFPSTKADSPITNFPLVWILPTNLPSILMSDDEIRSPETSALREILHISFRSEER